MHSAPDNHPFAVAVDEPTERSERSNPARIGGPTAECNHSPTDAA